MAIITPNWTKEALLAHLENSKEAITSAMIRDLILENRENSNRMFDLYQNYKGKKLAINGKTSKSDRPNNKLINDFRGEIVDQKVGYSFGNPITYELELDDVADDVIEKNQKALQQFVDDNSLDDLDTNTAKFMSVCGVGSRLLHIGKNKEFRIMNTKPWECIFIRDASLDEIVYAMRYWKMVKVEGETSKEFIRVEWYDDSHVYYYNEVGEYQFFADEQKPSEPHGFKSVPLIEFPNKEERLGDFEKVATLIDSYDKIMSFNTDELEAFRNAYLVFKNQTIDTEYMEKVKQTGGISLKDNGEVSWLTKDLKPDFVEKYLNRIENNIYRFSKTVNMNDEKFSGAGQSGESRKWKLKVLADDAMLKERSFVKASKEQFKVIGEMGRIIDIKAFDSITLQFTPNVPIDLKYQAETTEKLKSNVSEKTRLSLLSFVPDPEEELRLMAEELEETMAIMDERMKSKKDEEGEEGNQFNQNQNPEDEE